MKKHDNNYESYMYQGVLTSFRGAHQLARMDNNRGFTRFELNGVNPRTLTIHGLQTISQTILIN